MKVEADRDCFVAALFAMTVRNIEYRTGREKFLQFFGLVVRIRPKLAPLEIR